MTSLEELMSMETEEAELIPEILPVDARLSIKGQVPDLIALFERAASVSPAKEIIAGTGFALLESFLPTLHEVGYVRITATDARQTISVMTDKVSVAREGAVLLPAKRMVEILKMAPKESARIDVLGAEASILSGRAHWVVQTPSGSSLPAIPSPEGIPMHTVPREGLLVALSGVRKAVASTSGRPALAQVLIEKGLVTASDGGRIHRMVVPSFPKDLTMCVPRDSVDELMKALKAGTDELIEVGASDSLLVFKIDTDVLMVQRLLIGFPDVEAQILTPAFSNLNTLTVDTTDLAETVARVRVNSDPDYASIFLSLVPGKKTADGISWSLAVRARDRQHNTAQETLACMWSGSSKARELCLNHKYLTDLLTSYNSELAIFKVGDDTKTQRFSLFIEDSETGFTGVISQMRSDFM